MFETDAQNRPDDDGKKFLQFNRSTEGLLFAMMSRWRSGCQSGHLRIRPPKHRVPPPML